jgi:hypothetical protein
MLRDVSTNAVPRKLGGFTLGEFGLSIRVGGGSLGIGRRRMAASPVRL